MALQVWLPLNGDTNNYGLKGDIQNFSLNALTQHNDGKIGKCYGNCAIYHLSEDFLPNCWTIALWVKKVAAWNQYNEILTCKNISSSSTSQFYFSIINGAQLNIGINGGSAVSGGQYNYTFATNTWYHLAATYDGKNFALYINGNQVKTGTCTTAKPSGHMNLGIGCRCENNSNGTSQAGADANKYINDFRIYDHALSVKEIKELAKGLILHYRLSKPMPNLLSKYVSPGQASPGITTTAGRTNYLGNYSIQIPAAENADTYFRLFLTKELIQNNKYTFSCYVSGLKEGTYYNFPFFAQGNTGMGVIHLDHNGLNTVTFTMNSSTQNAITDPEGKTVYIMFMDDSGRNIASGQQPFQITQMKLEEGEKATAWIPNEYDPLYAAAGYASDIVYDCSGYQNNGIEAGTITGSSDTPRYRSSEFIQSSDPTKNNNTGLSYIKANIELTTPTTMTVSWWAKPLSGYGGSTNHAAWCTSVETEPTDYNSTAFHHRDARFNICPNSSSTTSINLTFNQYTANEWHHYVIVYDGLKAYAYKDAVQISSVTVGSSVTPLKSFNKIFIGFSKAGGVWRKTHGYYSDFRVYATALSADDIKALYEDAGYVDKNGNFHAYEFVEE